MSLYYMETQFDGFEDRILANTLQAAQQEGVIYFLLQVSFVATGHITNRSPTCSNEQVWHHRPEPLRWKMTLAITAKIW
jgi:hypothetical protein